MAAAKRPAKRGTQGSSQKPIGFRTSIKWYLRSAPRVETTAAGSEAILAFTSAYMCAQVIVIPFTAAPPER